MTAVYPIRPGDIVRVRVPGVHAKPKARVLRRSHVTGTLTVELVEPAGPHPQGAAVHVNPHECEAPGD